MSELKPCPFCGEAAITHEGDGRWFVQCSSQGCVCSYGESYDAYACPDHWFEAEDEAIAAWNTRAMSGWQDISTAPHDEVVLLYWQDWQGLQYMEATRFSTGERLPSGYSNRSEHGFATHWMPLPTPPKGDT